MLRVIDIFAAKQTTQQTDNTSADKSDVAGGKPPNRKPSSAQQFGRDNNGSWWTSGFEDSFHKWLSRADLLSAIGKLFHMMREIAAELLRPKMSELRQLTKEHGYLTEVKQFAKIAKTNPITASTCKISTALMRKNANYGDCDYEVRNAGVMHKVLPYTCNMGTAMFECLKQNGFPVQRKSAVHRKVPTLADLHILGDTPTAPLPPQWFDDQCITEHCNTNSFMERIDEELRRLSDTMFEETSKEVLVEEAANIKRFFHDIADDME